MTAATDSLENRTLDHRFRGQPDTPAATLYLALFTSATTDAGGGTEVTGNGYARVAIPCTLAAW